MKKTVVSGIALASTCLYGLNALANETSNNSIGADVLKTNFSLQEGYGKGVFKKNLNQYNVFGQYNLPKNFFLEYGYGYMTSSKRTNTIGPDGYYPGNSSPTLLTITFNSKITKQSPYLGIGWNYNIPSLSNTYISMLGGLSLTKVNGWFEIVSIQGIPFPAQPASRRSFSKTMPSIMLKAAINHKFTDHFGVRLSGVWQKLNNFRLNSTPIGVEIRLKNCTAVGLGMFYNV